jgi:hypothetical protein
MAAAAARRELCQKIFKELPRDGVSGEEHLRQLKLSANLRDLDEQQRRRIVFLLEKSRPTTSAGIEEHRAKVLEKTVMPSLGEDLLAHFSSGAKACDLSQKEMARQEATPKKIWTFLCGRNDAKASGDTDYLWLLDALMQLRDGAFAELEGLLFEDLVPRTLVPMCEDLYQRLRSPAQLPEPPKIEGYTPPQIPWAAEEAVTEAEKGRRATHEASKLREASSRLAEAAERQRAAGAKRKADDLEEREACKKRKADIAERRAWKHRRKAAEDGEVEGLEEEEEPLPKEGPLRLSMITLTKAGWERWLTAKHAKRRSWMQARVGMDDNLQRYIPRYANSAFIYTEEEHHWGLCQFAFFTLAKAGGHTVRLPGRTPVRLPARDWSRERRRLCKRKASSLKMRGAYFRHWQELRAFARLLGDPEELARLRALQKGGGELRESQRAFLSWTKLDFTVSGSTCLDAALHFFAAISGVEPLPQRVALGDVDAYKSLDIEDEEESEDDEATVERAPQALRLPDDGSSRSSRLFVEPDFDLPWTPPKESLIALNADAAVSRALALEVLREIAKKMILSKYKWAPCKMLAEYCFRPLAEALLYGLSDDVYARFLDPAAESEKTLDADLKLLMREKYLTTALVDVGGDTESCLRHLRECLDIRSAAWEDMLTQYVYERKELDRKKGRSSATPELSPELSPERLGELMTRELLRNLSLRSGLEAGHKLVDWNVLRAQLPLPADLPANASFIVVLGSPGWTKTRPRPDMLEEEALRRLEIFLRRHRRYVFFCPLTLVMHKTDMQAMCTYLEARAKACHLSVCIWAFPTFEIKARNHLVVKCPRLRWLKFRNESAARLKYVFDPARSDGDVKRSCCLFFEEVRMCRKSLGLPEQPIEWSWLEEGGAKARFSRHPFASDERVAAAFALCLAGADCMLVSSQRSAFVSQRRMAWLPTHEPVAFFKDLFPGLKVYHAGSRDVPGALRYASELCFLETSPFYDAALYWRPSEGARRAVRSFLEERVRSLLDLQERCSDRGSTKVLLVEKVTGECDPLLPVRRRLALFKGAPRRQLYAYSAGLAARAWQCVCCGASGEYFLSARRHLRYCAEHRPTKEAGAPAVRGVQRLCDQASCCAPAEWSFDGVDAPEAAEGGQEQAGTDLGRRDHKAAYCTEHAQELRTDDGGDGLNRSDTGPLLWLAPYATLARDADPPCEVERELALDEDSLEAVRAAVDGLAAHFAKLGQRPFVLASSPQVRACVQAAGHLQVYDLEQLRGLGNLRKSELRSLDAASLTTLERCLRPPEMACGQPRRQAALREGVALPPQVELLLVRKGARPAELARCRGLLAELQALMEKAQLLRPAARRLVFDAKDGASPSQDCDAFFLVFLACYCCSGEAAAAAAAAAAPVSWADDFAAQVERRLCFLRGAFCAMAMPLCERRRWESVVPFALSLADPPPSLRGARAFVRALLCLLAQATRAHERAALLSGLWSMAARSERVHSELLFQSLQQRLRESRGGGELTAYLTDRADALSAASAIGVCCAYFDSEVSSRSAFLRNLDTAAAVRVGSTRFRKLAR